MMQYSVGLYADLARETAGDRLAQARRPAARVVAGALRSPAPGRVGEASACRSDRLAPEAKGSSAVSTEGVVAAAFLPQDGYLDRASSPSPWLTGPGGSAPRSSSGRECST
jgi:hypothetical protein